MSKPRRTQPLPRDWGRIRKRILRRDHGRCYVCGRHGATHVDHVVPASRGGSDDDANLRAICGECHGRKTAAEANAANPMAKPRKRKEEKHPGAIG